MAAVYQPQLPGTRAKAARTVISKASEMVVARLTHEAVQQSFPDLGETPEDQQFIQTLGERVAQHLRAGFDETWANTFNESDLKDFAARADVAESAFSAAGERYNRREVPQDAWKRARDPEATIAASIIPKVSVHLQNVQDAREQLEAQADKKTQRGLQSQTEIEGLEADIRSILDSIQRASTTMASDEMEEMQTLLAELVEAVGPDNL